MLSDSSCLWVFRIHERIYHYVIKTIVFRSAFPCWLLANFLFLSVIRYGAYFTALTGAFQIMACILWSVIRNPNELSIPFENEELTLKYGGNFWLTLISGMRTFLAVKIHFCYKLNKWLNRRLRATPTWVMSGFCHGGLKKCLKDKIFKPLNTWWQSLVIPSFQGSPSTVWFLL